MRSRYPNTENIFGAPSIFEEPEDREALREREEAVSRDRETRERDHDREEPRRDHGGRPDRDRHERDEREPKEKGGKNALIPLFAPGNRSRITDLLKRFNIQWDAQDILLILIMLFLYLESDDEEILILLGLIFLMGI